MCHIRKVDIMGKSYRVRKIVKGSAHAEAIVCPGSFSFLGDVDMDSGEIIAESTGNKGENLAGKVLVYNESKGSSGGCVVLMTLANKGIAPAAIVTVKPADYNLTEGAILAGVPFVCEPDGDILSEIQTGVQISLNADDGTLKIL
jgi:predicted aconitase with swiveling domain